MKTSLFKMTLRQIGNHPDRYIAMVLILALGVGFFAGYKEAKPALLNMAQEYYTDVHLHDYQAFSPTGFNKDAASTLVESSEVIESAEGAMSVDFIYGFSSQERQGSQVVRAYSLPQDIDQIVLIEGRLPEANNEIVVDSKRFSSNWIGQQLNVASSNSEDVKGMLATSSYKVVGRVDSPRYVNYERGSSAQGSGEVRGFAYLLESGFALDYYTELDIRVKNEALAYSNEYENNVNAARDQVEEICQQQVDTRYDEQLSQIEEQATAAAAEEQAIAAAEGQAVDITADGQVAVEETDGQEAVAVTEEQEAVAVTEEQEAVAVTEEQAVATAADGQETAVATDEQAVAAAEEQDAVAEDEQGEEDAGAPKVTLVDRNAIYGYASFGIDVQIVENMANIFPWFFFLAAAMVCSTIMIRLVDEQRAQMGILLALGYRSRHVYRNYLAYALAAFVLGWPLGYFAGTYLFPRAVWMAYSILYIFPGVTSSYDIQVAVLSLLVALLCAVGSAGLCCWSELRHPVSSLMHRKAPKAGGRTILERIPRLFNHVPPALAMSFRNIFRYKIKSVMIVLGVCCCTAALLAGLGTRDSVRNISHYQFEEIHIYDYQVDFQNDVDQGAFVSALDDIRPEADVLFTSKRKATIACGDVQKTAQAIAVENAQDEGISNFIDLHQGEEKLSWPKEGEAVLSNKLAQKLGVGIGDTVWLTPDTSSDERIQLVVSGIADNYLESYIYLSLGSYAQQQTETPAVATALVNVPPGGDDYQTLADFANIDNVARVQSAAQQQDVFAQEMASFDLVVMLIIGCAGLLVLIVLHTLMSINIIERTGEIATVQALGMRPSQTVAHVFRENILLIAVGICLGLLAGIVVHRVVLDNIDIDAVYFNTVIEPVSFALTAALAILFSLISFILTSRKVRRISIPRSLGNVD